MSVGFALFVALAQVQGERLVGRQGLGIVLLFLGVAAFGLFTG